MRDPGQALARDQPAGAVPGHLQPERAGPAGIDRDREAVARLLAAERAPGSAGAPGLCAVTACRASSSQKKTGAESASPSPAPRNVPGARWLNTSGSWLAAVGKPVVAVLGQPGGDH
jgi:hypothetical protein